MFGFGGSEEEGKKKVKVDVLERELDEYQKEVKMLMGVQKQYTFELIDYVEW